MGSILFRNRYWFYRSLYDDYLGREFKLSFGVSCLLWMPHYWAGISINRSMEEFSSHKSYFVEFHPRRNRLTHSLIFQEFQMVLEDWLKLQKEYEQSKRQFKQMAGNSYLKEKNDESQRQYNLVLIMREKQLAKSLIFDYNFKAHFLQSRETTLFVLLKSERLGRDGILVDQFWLLANWLVSQLILFFNFYFLYLNIQMKAGSPGFFKELQESCLSSTIEKCRAFAIFESCQLASFQASS